jgi:hypothetical protein
MNQKQTCVAALVVAAASCLLVWRLAVSVGVRQETRDSVKQTNVLHEVEERTTNRAAAIPEQIEVLLNVPTKDIGMEVVGMLTNQPRKFLEAAYRQVQPPAKRTALILSYAYVGDENTVAMLTNSLLNDFEGKSLTFEDEEAVLDIVIVLGLLGGKHEAAYKFVRMAANDDFWSKHRNWRSGPEGVPMRAWTAFSIQALGMTGRPEVPGILRSIAETQLISRKYGTSVLGAMCFYDYRCANGDEIVNMIIRGDMFEEERKWDRTERAQQCRQWFKQDP